MERLSWRKADPLCTLQCPSSSVAARTVVLLSFSDELYKTTTKLNESQKCAVAAALNKTRPIVTIHGPPGTGKTAVITEIVMEAVLICAPSNVAVNNVVNRLKGFTEICSLGIDSELSLSKELEQLEKFSDVQSLIRNLDSENDVVSEMNSNARKKIWHVANKMLWSLKESVLKNKQVVACTLTNNSLRFLREQGFHPNVTVIDEAAQTLECVAWYSLLLSPRAVVVGDPWQLPPVLKTSQSAERSKTGNSLMDTLSKRFDQSNSFMLTEQYRMNKKIMEWPSSFFYNSQLHSSELVSNQLLSDISDMPKGNLFDEPMIFLDTSCNKSSDNKEKSCRNSFINTFEARLVTKYITMLSACGVRKEDIGVIAPYAAQVGLLRNSIRTSKVNSVDAFQGQEREVVVMSLVRNNNEGRMGFLKDKRRLNVAVTRARRQFILIGNAAMMRHTKHTKSLFEYIQRHGVIVKPDHLTRFKPHIRNRP
ncbi:unnamed protein product [Thelazia callipaeda]|uniref:AAA domain-containing protein n=1 Tax=Thelazia callipaeda TaxID=103827 RepID=A0A0N5CQ27_THECL|nr:unnamed protein product [Thelazia callipaeda]